MLTVRKIIEVMYVKTVRRTQKFYVCLTVRKIIKVMYVKTMNEHQKFSVVKMVSEKTEVLCYISALNQHINNLFSSANHNKHNTTNPEVSILSLSLTLF